MNAECFSASKLLYFERYGEKLKLSSVSGVVSYLLVQIFASSYELTGPHAQIITRSFCTEHERVRVKDWLTDPRVEVIEGKMKKADGDYVYVQRHNF